MGPITLFDKSFLQSLSVDEAVWYDHFSYSSISPIFFVETLADLWKQPRPGKTAEEEVGIIAAKTPEMHGGMCQFHLELCIQDLLGNHIPLIGRIPVADIRHVYRDGMEGAIAEVAEEAKAFQRWQRGKFLDVERHHAARWREYVENLDLTAVEKAMKKLGLSAKTCKSVDAALRFADEALDGLTKSVGRFDIMLEVLEIPENFRPYIKDRWKRKGKPPLRMFAPYAAHVLRVELFFRIALGANLISSGRPSNKIDIAYLFYLPFCMVFVSSDKLHRQCAPLFLRKDQDFVWGPDLKKDLAGLNAHYSALPEETRQQGIYKFANRLPDESKGVMRALFERHVPALLQPPTFVDPARIAPDTHQRIVENMRQWEGAREGAPQGRELETLIIKRVVRKNRGSWTQVGPEIADVDESGENE